MISWKPVCVSLVALMLCACGGSSTPDGSGGGIGGSGIIAPASVGYAAGTVTGFGSVLLNGNRFDTSATTISVNGESASQGQLRVGMQVFAQVQYSSSSASKISYNADLIGPIETAQDDSRRIKVLGQQVLLNTDTVLYEITEQDLTVGVAVEVSGVTDANGVLVASFIRRATANNLVQLSGEVTSVDNNAQVIVVRGIRVSTASAELAGVTQLTVGVDVVIRSTTDRYNAGSQQLEATKVRPLLDYTLQAGARIEFIGYVNRYQSNTSFSVNGSAIRQSNITAYQSTSGSAVDRSSLAYNSFVEVEGEISTSGDINASRFVVFSDSNANLTGKIESINTNSRSIRVLGLTAKTTQLTRYIDESYHEGSGFASLRVGDNVTVTGSYNNAEFVANKIVKAGSGNYASLFGPVTAVNRAQQQLSVMGLPIQLDENTVFTDFSSFPGIPDFQNFDFSGDYSNFIPGFEFSATASDDFFNRVSTGSIVNAGWSQFSSVASPANFISIITP